MPTTPWRTVGTPNPDREYLALLTYLPLRRYRSIPVFMARTLAIQKRLDAAPGIVGHSLKASPLSKRFWTLSVWEGEAALRGFVSSKAHRDAMTALASRMGPTSFTRWTLRGADLPPDWDDALRRQARP